MSHVCPHELCSPAFDASTCAGAFLPCPSGLPGQTSPSPTRYWSFARERSLVRPVELRRHSPMASGRPAIARLDEIPRVGASSRRAVGHRRHRRSIPLCTTFPTSRGDKFTDAVRPPQLPLLRDSKSFVKGISLVASSGQNSGSIRRATPAIACPQAVLRLNAAYPQGPRVLHRPREPQRKLSCPVA